MTRLIDADALKKAINDNGCRHSHYFDIFDVIDNAPTIEYSKNSLDYDYGFAEGLRRAREKKGSWIFTKYMVWQCSNCGGNPHTGTGFVPDAERMKRQWKYCNLCGADMRGGQDNDPN